MQSVSSRVQEWKYGLGNFLNGSNWEAVTDLTGFVTFSKKTKQKMFSCLWLPACFSQTHWARSVGPCCGSRGAPADSAWVATLESAASPPAGHSIAKKRANHHKGSPPGLPVLHPHRLDFLHLLHRPDPRLRGKTRTVSPELWRAEVGRQRQWMALLPSVMTSSAGYLRFLRLPAERKKKQLKVTTSKVHQFLQNQRGRVWGPRLLPETSQEPSCLVCSWGMCVSAQTPPWSSDSCSTHPLGACCSAHLLMCEEAREADKSTRRGKTLR